MKKILFFLIFFLIIFCRESFAEKFKSYDLGLIPKGEIYEMRDHTDALFYWMSAYLDGKLPAKTTLIHVDAHTDDSCSKADSWQKAQSLLDEFRKSPPDKRMKKFSKLIRRFDIGIDSFIIPALKMGLIDSFIWVAPNYHYFDSATSPYRRQPFFYYFLTAEQINKIDYCGPCGKEDAYCIEGCSIEYFETESFPAVSGPVILDIDMDTFGDASTANYCNLKFSPQQIEKYIEELIRILKLSASKVYIVTIADSPEEFSTPVALQKKAYLKEKLSNFP